MRVLNKLNAKRFRWWMCLVMTALAVHAGNRAGDLGITPAGTRAVNPGRDLKDYQAAVDEAWKLAAEGRFDDAVKTLDDFQKTAADPDVARKLEPIRAACLARRNERYEDAARNARALAAQNRIEEALTVIETFQNTTRHPDLAQKIEPMRVAYEIRWKEIFDAAVQEARRLAAEDRIEQALELIDILQQTTRDPELPKSLEPMRIAFLARRGDAVEKRIRKARTLATENHIEEALDIVEDLREKCTDPDVLKQLESMRVAYRVRLGGSAVPTEVADTPAPAPVPESVAAPVRPISHTAAEMWGNPRFRDQFVGSYAMTAAVEPPIAEDERLVLAEILRLMSAGDLDGAYALIRALYDTPRTSLEELGIRTSALIKAEAEAAEAAARAAAAAAAEAENDGKGRKGKDKKKRHTLFGAVVKLFGLGSAADAKQNVIEAAVAPQPVVETPRTVLENPSATFAYLAGNICFQRGDIQASVEWYRQAVAAFPSFLRAYKNLGMVEVRLGEFEAAVGSLTRALELGANDGLLYGLLGYAYSTNGNHLAAGIGYRSAILLQPTNLDWKMGLARSMFAQGQFDEAVALCGQLIIEKPDDPTLWRLQAKGYLAMNEPLKAARNYEYLRILGEADVENLNRLGDIYVKNSVPGAAITAYVDALKADPEQSLAPYVMKAKALAAANAPEDAARLLGAIKEVGADALPEDDRKEILRLEAWIALREGKDAEQARLLEEIVEIDPTDGEALISLGKYYARTDNPEKAEFYYERAVGIERFEARAKIYHAQLLVQQSKYDEAVPLLKSALLIEHRDEVAEYLKQVEAAALSRR